MTLRYTANYAILPKRKLSEELRALSDDYCDYFAAELWRLPHARADPPALIAQESRIKGLYLRWTVACVGTTELGRKLVELGFSGGEEGVFDNWFELIELQTVADAEEIEGKLNDGCKPEPA